MNPKDIADAYQEAVKLANEWLAKAATQTDGEPIRLTITPPGPNSRRALGASPEVIQEATRQNCRLYVTLMVAADQMGRSGIPTTLQTIGQGRQWLVTILTSDKQPEEMIVNA
ncbi:MAG: hypothetical protein J2O48_02570 [Solirubrobacterales bacterium]|nr:hypothetical protein [Solirubrobacterales bacterium]